MEELELSEFIKEPVKIFCDNNGAMKLAEDGNVTERTKHFMPKFNYTKELYLRGHVKLKYVASKKNVVDLFTKILPGSRTRELTERLGVY